MSKNCLVTKLKGVVNNPNLPKLGILPISVYAEENPSKESRRLEIDVKSGSVGSTLKAIDGHFATSYAGTYDLIEISTGNSVADIAVAFCENTDFNIEISNKYDIKALVYGLGIGFKLSDIGFYANSIENITGIGDGNTNVTGDIADLGICTNLVLFKNPYAYGIHGTIESFIEKQIANGRVSGTLVLQINTQYVTFNNTYTMQPNTKYYFVFADSGKLCTVGTGDVASTEMSQEIGSYDGSSWTWLI